MRLVVSTNKDGYDLALQRVWKQLNLSTYATPFKSSFSEMRKKVSFYFFKDVFDEDLDRVSRLRKTFRGLYVYAVDGSDLDLPASDDLIDKGFRGGTWSKEYESHYPKMYVVHAFDVLNEIVMDFKFSRKQYEKRLAKVVVEKFERNSLTIYDGLFCGQPVFELHKNKESYFLVRAQSDGKRVARCVRDFLSSNRCDGEVFWKAIHQKGSAVKVRLVKVRNPKTKTLEVFVTNLPKEKISRLDLQELYCRRWKIESSFKDLVSTFKMDQWHSMNLNGILQEIYCLLWLANTVKMQMKILDPEPEDLLRRVYRRSNFKLAMNFVVDNFHLLLRKRRVQFLDEFEFWLRRTRERRKHLSRHSPRVVRIYGTGFSVANKVPKRPPNLLTERY